MTRDGARRAARRRLEWGIACAVGLLLPDLGELALGFGSLLNLVPHSVLPAALAALFLARKGREELALAFCAGLAVHLLVDAWTGDSPFLASSGRRAAWLWLNAGLSAWPLVRARILPLLPTREGSHGIAAHGTAPA